MLKLYSIISEWKKYIFDYILQVLIFIANDVINSLAFNWNLCLKVMGVNSFFSCYKYKSDSFWIWLHCRAAVRWRCSGECLPLAALGDAECMIVQLLSLTKEFFAVQSYLHGEVSPTHPKHTHTHKFTHTHTHSHMHNREAAHVPSLCNKKNQVIIYPSPTFFSGLLTSLFIFSQDAVHCYRYSQSNLLLKSFYGL